MDEYAELMNNLKLPNPKMMDVAVPANMRVGLHQEEVARKGWALTAVDAIALRGKPDLALVDLREKSEREKHGVIPGSLHLPYPQLPAEIGPGGILHELAAASGKRLVFYCAFGERSAMAVQAAQDAGLKTACHIAGGIDAWKKASGPLGGKNTRAAKKFFRSLSCCPARIASMHCVSMNIAVAVLIISPAQLARSLYDTRQFS